MAHVLDRPSTSCYAQSMIPFQIHRRLPLIRRPFDQRDGAMAENAALRSRLAEVQGTLDALRPVARRASDRTTDLKGAYTAQVERTASFVPEQVAMSAAIGGDFDYIGAVEVAALQRHGLEPDDRVIDVGCGSGRLAKPLSQYLRGPYSGFDVVEGLVTYARDTVGRPDWRFDTVDHIAIPEPDDCADVVCFFSVLTHLLHEQSYWYLEEARRVVRPGGTILASFLEFADPAHWHAFAKQVENAKRPDHADPLSVFIERDVLRTWAGRLDLEVVDIHAGDAEIAEGLYLGQSLCVMRRPL